MREVFITIPNEPFNELARHCPQVGAEVAIVVRKSFWSRPMRIRFLQPGVDIQETILGSQQQKWAKITATISAVGIVIATAAVIIAYLSYKSHH